MKFLFILFISMLTFGCWSNPYEVLMPESHISIESSYLITNNNYKLLGDISTRTVKPIILFTSFPSFDVDGYESGDGILDVTLGEFEFPKRALYKVAMKSLKEKAMMKYGKNVGLINITMDTFIETPGLLGIPIFALFYYQKVIVLSADVIKFID